MLKNKNVFTAIITAVVMAIYTAVVMLIIKDSPRGFDFSFWFAYAMMMSSFAIFIGILFIVNKPNQPNIYFTRLATFGYLIIMFIFSTILYFFNFKSVIVAIIIVWILIFGIFIIALLLGLRQKAVMNMASPARISVKTTDDLMAFLGMEMFEKVSDAPFKAELKAVKSLITDNKEVEVKVEETCKYLVNSVKNKDYDNAIRHLQRIAAMIKE